MALLLRAFQHRNYRLFFAGQIVSLVGTFLSQVAIQWLVYRLTHKTWVLGITGFAAQIPMFLLTPFGGVLADRINRHRLIVITQALSMLQSFALAALALTPWVNRPEIALPLIIALAFFQGIVNAFDMPARQAFLVEIVTDRNDLANAIALNSTMVHAARLVGPALAGLLIYYVKEGMCFLLDGFSYLAVIAALLAMRVPIRPVRQPRSMWVELREGLRYVWGFRPVRILLIVMAVLSLCGMPAISILMPVFAEYFAGPAGGSRMLGFLMASSGVGALIGAIYLAARRSVVGLGNVIAMAAGMLGLALVAFSQSRNVWLSLAIVPVAGLAMIVNFAAANTVLQTLTEDHMRGRVMSFFSMAFLGMTPFGNLLAGAAAAHFGGRDGDPLGGAARAIFISGWICVAAGGVFALYLPGLRRIVAPIYRDKGILPRMDGPGLQAVTEAS